MPAAIRPHDVATYIEQLQDEVSAPSVKQQLAAVRMLFDWLVIVDPGDGIARSAGSGLDRSPRSPTASRGSALP
jgi:hypothetical protein